MRKAAVLGLAVALGIFSITAVAFADRGKGKKNGHKSFSAKLNGWQEVPSQVTTGTGSFKARVVSPTQISFTLKYRNLEEPNVAQAHIHISSFHENGGISAWLCGTAALGSTQPVCPAGPTATVTGVILAKDIVGPTAQGVEAGSFTDLIRALRKGEAYANVHTVPRAPGGEIRGQIRKHDDDDD